jgi:hypothetical protein
VDTRPTASDEARAAGAQFAAVDPKDFQSVDGYTTALKQLLRNALNGADVVIITPVSSQREKIVLLDHSALSLLKPGSVVVDLIEETRKGCVLTQPGQLICSNGLTIIAGSLFAGKMAAQLSEVYAQCVGNLLLEMGAPASLEVDELDELVGTMIIVKDARVHWYSRLPLSPTTALVNTGKIAIRLSIPPKRPERTDWFSRVDLALLAFIFLCVVLIFELGKMERKAEEALVQLVVSSILAQLLGWHSVSDVSVAQSAALFARTVLVLGVTSAASISVNNETTVIALCLRALAIFFSGLQIGTAAVLSYNFSKLVRS